MKAVSLFSGAGGMDAGFATAGVHATVACEMNHDAALTYASNFPGRVHLGDVRDLIPDLEEGCADVVFGGPPCQGYSVAGKMNPEDPRSALVHSFLEAVNKVRPKAFVMENVDALAKLTKWQGTLSDIKASAAAMGYETHVAVLDAADFGVPQARKRMFMWGIRSPLADMASIINEGLDRHRTERLPASTVFQRLGPAGTAKNPATCKAIITFCKNPVLRKSPYAGMLFNGAGRPIDPTRPAPTISASAGGNKTHIVDELQVYEAGYGFAEIYRFALDRHPPRTGLAPENLRRLTINESAAFQTFPEGFVFKGKTSSIYRQIGNAVPPLLATAVAHATLALIGAAA